MNDTQIETYVHEKEGLRFHHAYLLPALEKILRNFQALRVFEIGFGNGALADYLARHGYEVSGIEPSKQGVKIAQAAYPNLTGLHEGNVYDPLAELYGTFPLVVSFEVIEHLYAPRKFAATAFSLLEPGGHLILSTPYHGHLKNIAIVLLGKFESHFDPLWDHGHIKFWTIRSLGTLLTEAGFEALQFIRTGRIGPFAKSVLVVARRPSC